MKRLIMCAVICCAASNTYASKFGYTGELRAGVWQFKDPDGSSEEPVFLVPAIGIDWALSRTSRLVSVVDYWNGSFKGKTQNIKQDVKGLSIGAGIERLYSPSYSSKIWVGATLAYREVSFTDRRTEDKDGFTVDVFNDRESSFAVMGLSAKTSYKKISVGALAEFSEFGPYLAFTMGVRIQ